MKSLTYANKSQAWEDWKELYQGVINCDWSFLSHGIKGSLFVVVVFTFGVKLLKSMCGLYRGQNSPISPLCWNQGGAQGVECSVDVTCCCALSSFPRMDDIQLCNDIMDLKQELQNLVAIPGNHGGPHLMNQLLRSPVWKALMQPHSCNTVLAPWSHGSNSASGRPGFKS